MLKAALSRPGLTPAMEAAMLDAAGDISSDYELAELLIEVNTARPIDEAARPAFFKAANALHSDYEHRRVLDAVVARQGTSPAMLADVLTSAKTINFVKVALTYKGETTVLEREPGKVRINVN